MKLPFPHLMGEIQGQVVAGDINDDGKVEIVSADVRGNVAAWSSDGKELWTVHLKSIVAQVTSASIMSILCMSCISLLFAIKEFCCALWCTSI